MGLQPTPQPNPPIESGSPTRVAIEALFSNKTEKKRLYSYAHWRALPIQETVHHSDADDLVNEAIQRTLDGRREWNAAARTMFQHLLWCVSSIADEWYKEMKKYTEFSDLHPAPDTAHAKIIRNIALQKVRRRLKGDALAAAVFESILNDEKPSEAIFTLNISKKVYEAARRRVLRNGQKVFSSNRSARA